MPALDLSANQAALLASIKTSLQDALLDGVTSLGAPVLDPLEGYDSGTMTASSNKLQNQTKDIFCLVLAALLKNIGETTTVNYGAGTMTFVNGILISHT